MIVFIRDGSVFSLAVAFSVLICTVSVLCSKFLLTCLIPNKKHLFFIIFLLFSFIPFLLLSVGSSDATLAKLFSLGSPVFFLVEHFSINRQ